MSSGDVRLPVVAPEEQRQSGTRCSRGNRAGGARGPSGGFHGAGVLLLEQRERPRGERHPERQRKREEGDGRERDDLVVVTDGEGSSGGAAACGGAREAREEGDGGRRGVDRGAALVGRASESGRSSGELWLVAGGKRGEGIPRGFGGVAAAMRWMGQPA